MTVARPRCGIVQCFRDALNLAGHWSTAWEAEVMLWAVVESERIFNPNLTAINRCERNSKRNEPGSFFHLSECSWIC